MSTSVAKAPAPPSPPSASRRERLAVVVADKLLRVLESLPEARALGLAAGLCRTWARLGGPRTQVARVNLRIAFPSWSEAEREAVLVRSFENIGRSVAEFARLGRLGPEAAARRA